MKRSSFLWVAAVSLTMTACGSDAGSPAGSPIDTSPSTDASQPATSTVETTPTTAVVTTEVATTDAATDPAWTEIEPADAGLPLAYPCCASNWSGVASPPLTDGPIPDGVYAIEWEWPVDTAANTTLTARVTRFEFCGNLPAGTCEDDDPDFFPDELGESNESIEIPLRLDEDLRVVLGGWDIERESTSFWSGSGLDLAELVAQLDVDYEAAVLEPLRVGMAPTDISQELVTNPAYGFISAPMGGGPDVLAYSSGGRPALLFQSLVPYDADLATLRGSHVLGRIALRVEDGRYTVSVYAGFYS